MLQVYRDLKEGSGYWNEKEMRGTLRRLVEVYRKEGKMAEAAKYRRVLEGLS